jgi:predicted RNase H-like HicB family nuclease
MTHGNSRAEALANAAEAIEGWIETAREVGMEIPEPRYRPAIYAARDAA